MSYEKKVIIFDYDGTLHDAMVIYAPAVQAAYDRLVKAGFCEPMTLDKRRIREWIGISPKEMWNLLLPDLPVDERDRSIKFVGDYMAEEVACGRVRLYPGVAEMLEALRDKGHILVFLSTCPIGYKELHREHFGLDRYFHYMYCGEEFDYEPKYEIFKRIKRIKRDKSSSADSTSYEYIAVGDRSKDVEIGLVNGVRTVGCSYGFGTDDELSQADYVANSPEELLQILNKM